MRRTLLILSTLVAMGLLGAFSATALAEDAPPANTGTTTTTDETTTGTTTTEPAPTEEAACERKIKLHFVGTIAAISKESVTVTVKRAGKRGPEVGTEVTLAFGERSKLKLAGKHKRFRSAEFVGSRAHIDARGCRSAEGVLSDLTVRQILIKLRSAKKSEAPALSDEGAVTSGSDDGEGSSKAKDGSRKKHGRGK